MYHIVRVAASLFMYMAFYQLAGTIWMRLRTRRIFFLMLALGSGFGWVFGVITSDATYIDLTLPEAFPFYSTLVNIHYPLALAFLALLASVIIPAFRPGATEQPNPRNTGVLAFAISLLLVIVYPLALVGFFAVFIVYLLVVAIKQRTITSREWRWLLWVVAPALPLLGYYVAVLTYNDIAADVWWQHNTLAPPKIWVLALSLGLPLMVALPGLYRAVRRFEPDGDQFMLVWLIVMLLLVYLPTRLQLRFAIGLMIPVAYFATRALEDYWFSHIPRRWRYRVMMVCLPIILASHLVVLFLPLRPLAVDDRPNRSGLLMERDYTSAFDWLSRRVNSNDVILAAPSTSLWVPAWTGARVVYGHPTETPDARVKRRAVLDWFDGVAVDEGCLAVLDGAISTAGPFRVHYVLVGPNERELGETGCLGYLEPVRTFNTVDVYAYAPATENTP
jgi:hypothetical protein